MIALSKTSYKLFFIPRRTENDAFVHNKIKQICNQIMLVLSKTKQKKKYTKKSMLVMCLVFELKERCKSDLLLSKDAVLQIIKF